MNIQNIHVRCMCRLPANVPWSHDLQGLPRKRTCCSKCRPSPIDKINLIEYTEKLEIYSHEMRTWMKENILSQQNFQLHDWIWSTKHKRNRDTSSTLYMKLKWRSKNRPCTWIFIVLHKSLSKIKCFQKKSNFEEIPTKQVKNQVSESPLFFKRYFLKTLFLQKKLKIWGQQNFRNQNFLDTLPSSLHIPWKQERRKRRKVKIPHVCMKKWKVPRNPRNVFQKVKHQLQPLHWEKTEKTKKNKMGK